MHACNIVCSVLSLNKCLACEEGEREREREREREERERERRERERERERGGGRTTNLVPRVIPITMLLKSGNCVKKLSH